MVKRQAACDMYDTALFCENMDDMEEWLLL
jgi:hypothetical protein